MILNTYRHWLKPTKSEMLYYLFHHDRTGGKYRTIPVIFRYDDCFYLWTSHSLMDLDSPLLLLRVIIDVFYNNQTKQVI